MPTPKGYSSTLKEDRLTAQHTTVSPTGPQKYALDVRDVSTVFVAGSDAAEAGSTTSTITATAHSLLVGDRIRFTSGALVDTGEYDVTAVTTDTITLGQTLSVAPGAGDAFAILRPVSLTLSSGGGFSSVNTFVLDGSNQVVTEDTVTPANNAPLPVKLTGVTGDVNITAGDLNVQSSHVGANFDSIRVGDGTNLLAMNGSGEATVADATAQASLSSIDGKVATETTLASIDTKVATETTLAAADTKLGTIAGDTTSIDGKTPALGAAVTAASVPVNIASDQTVPVSAASLPLPSGAATEATLGTIAGDTTSLDGKVTACDTGNVTIASSALPTGAATEATLATLDGKVTACDTGNVTIASSALPTGAATETTLSSLETEVTGLDKGAGAVSANTRRVHLTDETLAALENITVIVDPASVFATTYTDASSTNIPGSATAPLELIASTGSDIKEVQVFDTTGVFLELMTGAAASEVRVALVGPGNDQPIKIEVSSGTRISVRRVDSTSAATVGSLAINYLG